MPEPQYDNLFKKLFFISSALMLLTMCIISFDFGISGDERDMKLYGDAVFNYFATFGEDTSYQDLSDQIRKQGADLLKYYGGLFDFLASALNKVSPFNQFDTRHLLNAIFGFIAMFFTGLLAKELGGWRAGLIALWLIFLSPRFLGHSMNNPKDIPFATAFIASLYFMIIFVKQLPKPSRSTIIWLGVCIAASINIRVGGLLLFAYLFFFTAIEVFFTHENKKRFFTSYALKENLPVLKSLLFVCLIGYLGGVLLWPYGLQNPITHPLESLKVMSDYSVNLNQLFEGKEIWSSELPGYYLPKYMVITNPLAVLIGFVLLLCFVPYAIKRYNPGWLFMAFFAGVFPVAYIIIQDANVYGGWRHVLFAYPPLVALSAIGWDALLRYFKTKNVVQYTGYAALAILLFLPLRWSIANHPNEYVYFNELVGGIEGAYGNYETDYWMNSLKPALEWMEENDLLNPENGKIILTSNAGTIPWYKEEFANDSVKLDYVRYYQRLEKPWDYAIFYSGYVNPAQLRNKTWPPVGTIHVVKAGDVPLAAVVKRPGYEDYEGFQAMQKQNFTEAIAKFTSYLEKDPNNETVLSNLGMAYYYSQQPARAAEFFGRAIEINPGDVNSLNMLGNIYLNAGKMNEAIMIFDRIVKQNPGFAGGYFGLGVAYAQSGNLDIAISYLKSALQLNPGMKQAYDILGKIYQQKGDRQTAQQYFEYSKRLGN